jgi:hypothetical protein
MSTALMAAQTAIDAATSKRVIMLAIVLAVIAAVVTLVILKTTGSAPAIGTDHFVAGTFHFE